MAFAHPPRILFCMVLGAMAGSLRFTLLLHENVDERTDRDSERKVAAAKQIKATAKKALS